MKILILAGLASVVMSVSGSPSIIPQPTEIRETGGIWDLAPDVVVVYTDEIAKQPAELLAAQLRPATGFKLPIKPGVKGNIVFQISEDPALGKEGYELRITDHVLISAPTSAGLFYGAQTLRQLLPPEIYGAEKVSALWKMPKVEICDVPRFGWRGMMLDVSRYFFNKEFMLRYLDMMAMHKANVLHWHLIDDAGWRIEIKKYPKLTEIGGFRGEGNARYGGFYTQEDIREIVQYAADRHIIIVPEVELPAHTLSAIAAYPYLSCTGEQQTVPTRHSISRELYCAGKETTWTFLEEVMDEVCGLFPGSYIHIGGDEARYDRWKSCPDCQIRIKENGLNGEKELQGWMTRRIETMLQKHGKQILGWDEILNCGISEQAGIMTWHRPQTAITGAKRGNPVVMALTQHCYFDTSESHLAGEPPAATWIPPISLKKAYEWNPVPAGLEGAAAQNILGAQGCVWSDQFMHAYDVLPDRPGEGTEKSEAYIEYLTLPRLSALAEVCWTDQTLRTWEAFSEHMKMQYNRYDSAGWNYRTPLPQVEVQQNADGTFIVSARPPMRGATVRYTLDGTEPSAHSAELPESLGLKSKDGFKAVTVAADGKRTSLVLDFEENLPARFRMFGKLIGEWAPETVASAMTFKATGTVEGNGTYIVAFAESKRGKPTEVKEMKLLKNGRVVAKGNPLGIIQAKRPKTMGFEFKVSDYETGADYVLEASVVPGKNRGFVLIKMK